MLALPPSSSSMRTSNRLKRTVGPLAPILPGGAGITTTSLIANCGIEKRGEPNTALFSSSGQSPPRSGRATGRAFGISPDLRFRRPAHIDKRQAFFLSCHHARLHIVCAFCFKNGFDLLHTC